MKLRKWVKDTIVGIVLIIALGFLIKINNDMQQDFIDTCEDLGYSYNYCVSHS